MCFKFILILSLCVCSSVVYNNIMHDHTVNMYTLFKPCDISYIPKCEAFEFMYICFLWPQPTVLL